MEQKNSDDTSIEFTGDSEDPRVQNGNAYDTHGPFDIPENIKKIYVPKFGWEIRRETRDANHPMRIFFFTETRLRFAGHRSISIVDTRCNVAVNYKSMEKDSLSFAVSGEMITRDGGSQVYTVAYIPKEIGKIKLSEDKSLTAPRITDRSKVTDAPWLRDATGWTALQRTADPSKVAQNNKATPFK